MDAVWLRDFQKLAPSSLDVVLVDDSEAEEERRSDNTGTGERFPVLLGPCINGHTATQCCATMTYVTSCDHPVIIVTLSNSASPCCLDQWQTLDLADYACQLQIVMP